MIPKYKVIKETGKSNNKTFVVEVVSKDEISANGTGASKQKAQQEAAKALLKKIEG